MINGKTLQNMKIIKKFSPNEKDLKESTAPTKLMTDFMTAAEIQKVFGENIWFFSKVQKVKYLDNSWVDTKIWTLYLVTHTKKWTC